MKESRSRYSRNSCDPSQMKTVALIKVPPCPVQDQVKWWSRIYAVWADLFSSSLNRAGGTLVNSRQANRSGIWAPCSREEGARRSSFGTRIQCSLALKRTRIVPTSNVSQWKRINWSICMQSDSPFGQTKVTILGEMKKAWFSFPGKCSSVFFLPFPRGRHIIALKLFSDSASLMLQPAPLLNQFLWQEDVGCQILNG